LGDRLGGLATNGSLARTVADAAALLDTMSGYITGDPYWLPDPNPSFLDCAYRPPGSLRIGFATQIPPAPSIDPICTQAVVESAKCLEQLGHQVEPVTWPDLSKLIDPFKVLWQCVVAEVGVPIFVLEKFNRWLLQGAWFINSGAYLQALDQVQIIAREIVAFCKPYDVILLPVYTHPAIRVGEWANLRSAKTLQNVIQWVLPCPPFNASGQPSIAIPTGFDPQGVPIGVQLVGQPAGEATLISLAAQLEEAQPWIHQRPAIAQGIG
jgi:amidase